MPSRQYKIFERSHDRNSSVYKSKILHKGERNRISIFTSECDDEMFERRTDVEEHLNLHCTLTVVWCIAWILAQMRSILVGFCSHRYLACE
jgi:hypothetical protein